MPNPPIKLRVRPARRTCEQLLREEVLVVSAARTGPAKLQIEALEQRLPGARLVAESTDAPVPCDEPLPPPHVRNNRLARPGIADQPCDPLVVRGVAPTSWAFADPAPAESTPLAQAVQFVTAAATTGVDAMAVVGFDAGGQVIGGRAANPASLRYVLSGEVGGWIADIAAA